MRRNVLVGQKPVFMQMQKHPGIVYTSESMLAEMHLADDANFTLAKQVNRAMVGLCEKGQIERVGQGRYLYRKPPKENVPITIVKPIAGNVYESIGLRKSTGNVIVKDVDNNLYELHEL